MTKTAKQLVFAWTHVEESTTINIAIVDF